VKVEDIKARTVLGVSAKASEMEIEAAYGARISAVRKQFDDARDHRTREKYKREHNAIEEARSKLLRDLKDQEQRQREESQRLAAEQRQGEENQRSATEQRQREESHRLATEQRQREESQRLAAEQRQREESQRLAAEQRQREESQRLAAEQRQREESHRLAAEQRQREENQRLAAEQHQREKKKRLAARPLLIGGLVLILACLFAAVLFWPYAPSEPKLAKLVLNTLPANADVFVDGVSRGKTPLALDDIVPGERQLLIQLEGYQDEKLIVLIKPGDQRFYPPVTLIPKPVSIATPTPSSPAVTPTPSSPAVTPTPGSPTVTPALSGYPGERFPQTRQRLLTEAEVANLDYAELRYAINEMYARHGAQFLKEPDIRKQFEKFSWYYPIPEMTLSRIEREFTRIEKQNRDLLARLRDQKRHR
jgi:hypothetical protein